MKTTEWIPTSVLRISNVKFMYYYDNVVHNFVHTLSPGIFTLVFMQYGYLPSIQYDIDIDCEREMLFFLSLCQYDSIVMNCGHCKV